MEGHEDEEISDGDNHEDPLVFLHALADAASHQTIRFRGNIKKKGIIILIDSGSTHNFWM